MSYDQARADRLGLHIGQFYPRELRAFKNLRWYNEQFMDFGGGDLTIEDPDTISFNLGYGEVFLGLRESDAGHWEVKGKNLVERLLPEHSRRAYLADHFALFVVPHCVYLPGKDEGTVVHPRLGERPTLSSRTTLRMMKHAQQRHSD